MPVAASVTVNTAAFRRSMGDLFMKISKAAQDSVQLAAIAAERRAKQTRLFKDRTGTLRKSIKVMPLKSIKGGFSMKTSAGVAVRYAKPVHFGSVPHPIAPRKEGGLLKFVWKNKIVFRRFVIHPGTNARPFMTRAGESTRSVLEYQAQNRLDAAIEAFNRGG